MNILLTGGTGYIGSHTAVVLTEAGHRVVLYDNFCNSQPDVVQRLEKIMDEYAGGISTFYVTSAAMLKRGLELLTMLKEDLEHLGAEDLHQLQRAWELHHRVWTAEAVLRHTLYRQETRWPGYYYRGDYPRPDDGEWHVFTASQYDAQADEWRMSKLPVHHIVA